MAFAKGVSGCPTGRPKVKTEDKPTNRTLREKSLMELVRKFRPLQTKAINAAVHILDSKDASEGGKLKSAALIIQTYKELIKEVYDQKYDEQEAVPIQEDNKPKFSLHMIPSKELPESTVE
jgi:hypothetical protein